MNKTCIPLAVSALVLLLMVIQQTNLTIIEGNRINTLVEVCYDHNISVPDDFNNELKLLKLKRFKNTL